MHYAVEIKNLTVKIKSKTILSQITFNVPINSIVAIIGPNGGGKTTLLRTILGLQEFNEGKIKIFEKYTPKNYPPSLIGYLPQKILYNLKFPAKVIDIVLMARYPKKGLFTKLTREDHEIAEKSLEKLGVLKYKNEYFQDLSSGLKQRVLIARALANEPKLLIFDEPSTGLDIISQKDFYELLLTLKKEGLTILMVSHDIGIISNYVDIVAGLNKKIHFYGKIKETLTMLNLEKIFGKNFSFIIHEKNCETCRYGTNSL